MGLVALTDLERISFASVHVLRHVEPKGLLGEAFEVSI